MPCHQLIYTSQPTLEITEEILLNILRVSQNKNHNLRISGLLVFGNGKFIQLLEGDEKDVQDLFHSTIQRDPRHTDVKVLLEAESPTRCMPTWTMGFSALGNSAANISNQNFYIPLAETRQLCELMEGEVGQRLLAFLDA
jgi:hypothetical protein